MSCIQGSVDCTPGEAGYDASRIEAVNAFFAKCIKQKIIHGVSYRLARHGKVFAAAAMGGRHYKQPNILMQPDTPFRIASQTKAFTAVAVQILVEEGRLAIEDSVSKYLPQFDGAPYDQITLFHLLTHTSGLYPEGSIPDKHHADAYAHIEKQGKQDGKNTDWIAAGLQSGMRRKPGEEWQYCSFGIAVLGAVIHAVSGIHAESFIIERICKPLGMNDTTFNPSPDMARQSVVFTDWNERDLERIQQGIQEEESVWDLVPNVAGGLYSTTKDLIRFGMMLQQGGSWNGVRVLGRKAVESMATQRLSGAADYCWGSNTKDRHYGLGVDMRRYTGTLTSPGTYFHEGAGHSVLIVDPAEGMVCSCVYPWVNEWDGDCNNRLYNVMWSGLI